MKFKYAVILALNGLKANKSRSFLTILGIVIAIMSIILMVSIGKGSERLILNEIAGFGTEIVVIRPGQEPTGLTDFSDTLFADSLNNKDLAALKKRSNVPDLVDAMPALIVPGSLVYEGESFRPTIMGGKVDFFADAFNIDLAAGRLYDDSDIKAKASVVVIGHKVKTELFGNSDAIGKLVTLKDRKFRVVGVFKQMGQAGIFNFDDIAVIPYTTAQTYLLGIDHYHEIITKAISSAAVSGMVKDIERTLRESHDITNSADDDFYIVTQQGAVDQIKSIIGALTIFLSSVVAIALVVGGIGVMNIMLVSVTERTREVGLRKALGATNRDILTQFLFEAIILTGLGGMVGILMGGFLAYLTSIILRIGFDLNWSFTFPYSAALLGFLVSTSVGLVFGLYPAKEAAKKNPIEALRYE